MRVLKRKDLAASQAPNALGMFPRNEDAVNPRLEGQSDRILVVGLAFVIEPCHSLFPDNLHGVFDIRVFVDKRAQRSDQGWTVGVLEDIAAN